MALAIIEEKMKALSRQVALAMVVIDRMEEAGEVHQPEVYEKLRRQCDILGERSEILRNQRVVIREMCNVMEEEKKVVPVNPWASISFHQFHVEVGQVLLATDPVVTIDNSTWPSIDLCLDSTSNVRPDATLDDALTRIQQGVRFIREGEDVSVQCLSDRSVFVHSIISNQLLGQHWATVIEVPTGSSLKLFSYKEFARLLNVALKRGHKDVRTLALTSSIRMSFGGEPWGPGCPMTEVTSTPCWIDMHLLTPLAWLTKILEYKGHPVSSP